MNNSTSMNITEVSSTGLKRHFSITVSSQSVEQSIEQKLKDIAPRVKLPGFRPGKVPANIVRKNYEESVRADALQAVVDDAANKIVKENKFNLVDSPTFNVKSKDKGEDFCFELFFEILPTFELKDVGGFNIPKISVAVSDAEVEETMKELVLGMLKEKDPALELKVEDVKITEDVLKDMQVESIEKLKENVRLFNENRYKFIANLYTKRQILDRLDESYDFELPESMVENEFQSIYSRLQQEIQYAEARGEISEEEKNKDYKQEYREIAERRVRLGLVMSSLADKHNLALTKEEINQILYNEISKYPEEYHEKVAQRYINSPQLLRGLTGAATEEKVVEFIRKQGLEVEQKLSVKEFKEKVKDIIPYFDDEDEEEELTEEVIDAIHDIAKDETDVPAPKTKAKAVKKDSADKADKKPAEKKDASKAKTSTAAKKADNTVKKTAEKTEEKTAAVKKSASKKTNKSAE